MRCEAYETMRCDAGLNGAVIRSGARRCGAADEASMKILIESRPSGRDPIYCTLVRDVRNVRDSRSWHITARKVDDAHPHCGPQASVQETKWDHPHHGCFNRIGNPSQYRALGHYRQYRRIDLQHRTNYYNPGREKTTGQEEAAAEAEQ